ncbi:MFS transporter [Microvirga terrestris]|uniref:MFS transporter n=1 Tax=Microvirga terrestris TaxID=2791024 RepID=A0ABS0HUT9_9HYPH|nr:MFS transporter [Microvirga terrestris]MBF9197276.1 MFS transporter [Microvirga terrestris]
MTLSNAMPRAGHLECLCAPAVSDSSIPDHRGTVLLAAAFALSVLSQVLTLTVLPVAGMALAPSGPWMMLPYAAFYAGAALASLPASLLLDAMGRRAAFSLGASLGIAGGLILAWALVHWHFGALALGAFWLGIASGFSLFYRHAAAPLGGRSTSDTLLVFGAATLAGLLAPTVADTAGSLTTPNAAVGLALASALAHVGSLLITATLPYRRRSTQHPSRTAAGWRRILWPSLIGAAGWFAMTALMGATPIAMIGCGLADAVPGAIAWHVIAMYAPSLALAGFRSIRPRQLTMAGSALVGAAAVLFLLPGISGSFSASAAALGMGWSLVTLGTTLWLHEEGELSRLLLGLHDAGLLGAALLGAVAAGFVP